MTSHKDLKVMLTRRLPGVTFYQPVNRQTKGTTMKLGKEFWFWVRLIIEILKAILGLAPPNSNPAISRGERAFNAVLGALVEENEDDAKKTSDLQALVRK